MAAVGASVGYAATGTAKGAIYGGIAGGALGTTIVLYRHDPSLVFKALGLGFAGGIISLASYYTDSVQDGRTLSEIEATEAFLKGLAVATTVVAGVGALKVAAEPLLARALGQPDLALSVIAAVISEVSLGLINGTLVDEPERVLLNIAIASTVNYVVIRVGFGANTAEVEKLVGTVFGFTVARMKDAFVEGYEFVNG